MSEIDENQIHDRLKRLSQVEPTKESTGRAMQKVRDALIADEGLRAGLAPPPLIGRLMKLAAAAVLMISAGYIAGRISAPEPVNVHELQAAIESSLKSSLEPAIRRQLLDDIENRLQLALAADRDMLKQELAQQVRRDLELFAEQTLTAAGNLTEQRLIDFARMLEAARIKERRHVAAAFDYMGSRFGDGLITLATQRDNLPEPGRTSSELDVSEN